VLPPLALLDPMVGEACAYVQGESLKAWAALLVRLLNSPVTSRRGVMESQFERSRPISPMFTLALVFLPPLSAWFLLRPGYSTRARVIAFSWMFVFLVIFMRQKNENSPEPQKAVAAVATSAQPTSEDKRPHISAEAFEMLMEGRHTKQQLFELLGDGELRSSNYSDGLRTEAYEWQNADGSVVHLIFQNGRLVQKSQSGLR
jgi:hypothetical protein